MSTVTAAAVNTGEPPPAAVPKAAASATVSTPPAKSAAPAATEPNKPGYQTTEFWISALALVGFLLAAVFHWSDSQVTNWTQGINQFAPFVAMFVGYLVTNQYCSKRMDLKKSLAGKLTLDDLKVLLPQALAAKFPGSAGVAADASSGVNGMLNFGGTIIRIQNGRIVEATLPQAGNR